jgi:hypothetical protein
MQEWFWFGVCIVFLNVLKLLMGEPGNFYTFAALKRNQIRFSNKCSSCLSNIILPGICRGGQFGV